jgi:hypothetical protein
MTLPASLESRRLLNPGFTGALLVRAAHGFKKEAGTALPFIYAHLVLPLVLHPETRERLPNSVVTKLLTWTERNGDVIAPLPNRIVELAHATREAVFLITTTGMANLGDAGEIDPALAEKALASFAKSSGSNEVLECFNKANFVGRWLGTSGTIPTVLTVLGVNL